jgi:putative phosphoribosyl transferase
MGARHSPNPTHELWISIGGAEHVGGTLHVPEAARGLIVFAHGSGSSRMSPRNRYVAEVLQQHRFATLLADLLTQEEEARDRLDASCRFDIALLARRLTYVVDWSAGRPDVASLQTGLFGASTGAAAALAAAAAHPGRVFAIVSRGGRPDLAGSALRGVRAPTLLIVGGDDPVVLSLNRAAMLEMPAERELVIVPGATHLFEEPGALEAVAGLAAGWFDRHAAA